MKASRLSFCAIISILLASLCWTSCTTSRLRPGQALLKKNEIIGAKDGNQEEMALSYVRQKPNRKFFFLFKANLYLYNIANRGKSRAYKEKIKTGIGEAPVIYDSLQTRYSAGQINQYLFSKGYFLNTVKDSVSIRHKKATVYYRIRLNKVYTIDTITTVIADPVIDSIYKANSSESLLRQGDAYDEQNMQSEQERIYGLMRNRGYYHFLRQYITYSVDSSLNSYQVAIQLRIANPEGQNAHLTYTIDKVRVNINPDLSSNRPFLTKDTLNNGTYYYYDPENRFNPNTFNKMLFIKEGELFAQRNTDLTYNRLGDLGEFRFSGINYQEDSLKRTLDCSINLSPAKQFSLRPEIEGTFNSGNFGGNGSLGYSNRNVFKGAELLELGVKGGFETRRAVLTDNNLFIFRRQISVSGNLYFPKLFLPFLQANYRFANPRTFISINYAYEKRESFFFRRYLNTAFGYDWRDTRTRSHYIKLADINIVSSALSPALTQSLRDEGNFYLLRSFVPYFSLGTQYRYTDNQQDPKNPLKDYYFLRFSIDVAGNSLNLLKNILELPRDSSGAHQVFGLIYYQYLRPDIDFRYYNIISQKSAMVFRFNPGIGLSYGNSKNLPYEKQFFVGGSNSLRAWRARQLGPGEYSPVNGVGSNTTFLEIDRTGDVKLEANAEYRFEILRSFLRAKLNGAFFVDAGNVWFLKKDSPLPGAQIKLNKLINDIAIGTGAGLRLDYSFFIFRFDVGLKLKDPFYQQNNGWVIERFSDSDFKRSNNYTFFNYNFGIGYPF